MVSPADSNIPRHGKWTCTDQTLTAPSIDAITSQLEALIPNRLHPKPHMVCIPRIEVSFVQVMGEVEVAQQVRGFGDIGSTGGDYYTATTAG